MVTLQISTNFKLSSNVTIYMIYENAHLLFVKNPSLEQKRQSKTRENKTCFSVLKMHHIEMEER